MTMYSYRALTAAGKKTAGTIEAANRREAGRILRSRGVHVTDIEAADGRRVSLKRGVSARRSSQTYLFTSFMRRLLRAGMPLVEALNASAEELAEYPIGAAVERIGERVSGGSSLAEALEHEGGFFDDLYVAMISAAERSGALATAFETIHSYDSKRRAVRRRLISALTYPAVLVGVSVLAVGFLLGFVIPTIEKTLLSFKIELPLPTRVVLAVGGFAGTWWPAALVVFVVILFAPAAARLFPAGRRFVDAWVIRLPVVGKLSKAAVVGRFARTFAALLRSGLRVADGLETAGRVSGNDAFERALDEARGRIVSGGDLAGALGESGVFPGYVLQIVSIGERTGGLAEAFEDVAVSEEEAFEVFVERALTLLEPAIIVVMAFVVGFIVASVLLPILSLSKVAG
jgi:type IV pilus assembly protein PilC